MSLRFSATCPRHFATFCDTSLSFAIFYDTSQNRKDMSQNRKDMSQVAKDTSQNRKDTSQNFATCQNVLAIFCDIVRHVSDFCDMPHPPPQPPIHSSSGCHVFDEWPRWPQGGGWLHSLGLGNSQVRGKQLALRWLLLPDRVSTAVQQRGVRCRASSLAAAIPGPLSLKTTVHKPTKNHTNRQLS